MILHESFGLPYLEKAIRCDKSGMISYNPNDIANLYCGHCHEFMTDGRYQILTGTTNRERKLT